MELCRDDFGSDFVWGVSSAAYQIEGAYAKDGKGMSIWDEFVSIPGKIRNNDNANISSDFYHHYPSDLSLMRSLNIRNYRFSLSWSRLFPEGTGAVNRQGIDFYKRVIDFCLELGIKPWITLYHWDLPLALEKKGGWPNREMLNWFAEYVAFCAKTFGDSVKDWMVLNEPMAFTGAGYFLGVHAPGRKNVGDFLAAAHHACLCQAEGGRILRSECSDFHIGTTFSCTHVEPLRNNDGMDRIAAKKVDALLNRLFIEPLAGLGYPTSDLRILQKMEPFIRDGDEQKLNFDMDYIGIQHYTREKVAHSYLTPYLQARIVNANERKVHRTLMNWEIYPDGMYHVLKKFNEYGFPKLIVTENGAAFPDHMDNGRINDFQRRSYLESYIREVLRAKKDGVNVNGYFVWTLTDNFEWAEGYDRRFGIVHVDFATQKRTVKNSGYWYSNFLSPLTSKRNGQTLTHNSATDSQYS